jgi:hypothetical protein
VAPVPRSFLTHIEGAPDPSPLGIGDPRYPSSQDPAVQITPHKSAYLYQSAHSICRKRATCWEFKLTHYRRGQGGTPGAPGLAFETRESTPPALASALLVCLSRNCLRIPTPYSLLPTPSSPPLAAPESLPPSYPGSPPAPSRAPSPSQHRACE